MSDKIAERPLTKLQRTELPVLLAQLNLPEQAAATVNGCQSVVDVLAALESGHFGLEAMRVVRLCLA